jgi:hypothetical protein
MNASGILGEIGVGNKDSGLIVPAKKYSKTKIIYEQEPSQY